MKYPAAWIVMACGGWLVGCATATLDPLPPADYAVSSADSSVTFTIDHNDQPLTGRFNETVGVFTPPAPGISSRPGTPGMIEVAVPARRIDTANGLRDAHLRTGDFFDVGEYPAISFRSDRVTAREAGLRAEGTLTLLGVEQPLAVDLVPQSQAGDGPAYRTAFMINRSDFGLTGGLDNGSIGDAVALEVVLSFQPHSISAVGEDVPTASNSEGINRDLFFRRRVRPHIRRPRHACHV